MRARSVLWQGDDAGWGTPTPTTCSQGGGKSDSQQSVMVARARARPSLSHSPCRAPSEGRLTATTFQAAITCAAASDARMAGSPGPHGVVPGESDNGDTHVKDAPVSGFTHGEAGPISKRATRATVSAAPAKDLGSQTHRECRPTSQRHRRTRTRAHLWHRRSGHMQPRCRRSSTQKGPESNHRMVRLRALRGTRRIADPTGRVGFRRATSRVRTDR